MELPLRPSSAVPRSRALTLVELLVVVTVIGVLLSLMLTVVGSLRSAAVRVSCLANLHRWSVALIGYADDNRGLTPNAIRAWMVPGTEVLGRTPYGMWRTPADGPANELNLPAMRPYLEGADGAGSTIGRPWFCPSTSVANIDSGIGYPVEWLDYAYYSMSTRPDPAWCTDPAAMFCPRLNPTGLLMSDRVVHWGSADLWFYNHTRRGSNYGFASTAQFVGANQLFGDGHAAWKTAGAFGPLATGQWFGDICGDHCYF